MKLAGGQVEDGIVVGNIYDKYGSQNPIVRHIMRGFDDALTGLVDKVSPATIHEIGCGEGYWVTKWLEKGIDTRGSDFSKQIVAVAQLNARQSGLDESRFSVRSIYDVTREHDSADLIVCCEVMEHLEHPERAMMKLQDVVAHDLIISVPREPLWRILNLARGKYIADLGNTPGHLQHWSRKGITQLAAQYFEIIEVLSPIPWTMIHCRRK